MDQWLTETADTQRKGAVDGSGFEQAEANHLTDQPVTPVTPVDAYTLKQKSLGEFVNVQETYSEDCDIIADDKLTVDGTDYRVVAVERWPWRGETWLHIFLEEKL